MHDRIRLALSAAGIAAVTLLASGHPLPSFKIDAQAKVAAPAAESAQATVAPVAAEIPVVSDAPKVETPEIRAPRIRRAAGADVTQA